MPHACWGRRLLAAAALVALVAVACTGDDDEGDDAATTTSTEPETTTTAIDYTQVSLAPVPGSTTTTIALQPGEATLQGVVAGPDGPVAGAIVRIDRFVGDSVATGDVRTAEDGTWRVEKLLGGRYRVRAWLTPDLGMAEPAVFFLEAKEEREVDLRVEIFSGTVVRALTDPDPPVVGSRTNLGVRLMSRLVDDQGIVRGYPLAGIDVRIAGSGRWQVHSDEDVTTDSTGNAAWSLTCRAAGEQPLSVVIAGDDVRPLDLSKCVAPEPPSTTTTSSDGTTTTTTSSDGTTSSTSSSSTTTTTEA